MELKIIFYWTLILFLSRLVSGSGDDVCDRNCTSDPNPRICSYEFVVESYLSMSKACFSCPLNVSDCRRPQCIAGNGVQRKVTVANRRLPGPSLHLCVGDTLNVTVINAMGSDSTSIHWHGIKQRSSPYMDGVPMITQCPIAASTTFLYTFQLQQSGTYFWHGHSGLQRADGLFGPLIIRTSNDPLAYLYDRDENDHVITVNDWMSVPFDDAFADHVLSNGSDHPQSVLVNGRGRFKGFYSNVSVDEETRGLKYTPFSVFKVEQGLRYRFRVIYSGALNCPLQMSIDGHVMIIIATDGSNLEPSVVDSLVINSGERFDVVVHANQNVSNYWIKFRGMFDGDQRFTSAFQMAVLSYDGADSTRPPDGQFSYQAAHRPGKTMNAVNMEGMDRVNTLQTANANIGGTPDHQFYLSFDFDYINNPLYNSGQLYPMSEVSSDMRRPLPLINQIYFQMPPSPLLSQFDQVDRRMFCNSSTLHANCSQHFCECVHLLTIRLNSLVEIVLVDEGFTYNTTHPMHLHGYSFHVVSMEKVGYNVTVEKVKALDADGKIRRRFDRPIEKDTVAVPSGGYVIIRFLADNPGFWFLHCHLDFHLAMGMGVIFQVGNVSDYQPPPLNFPKCGNWVSNSRGIDTISDAIHNNDTVH